MAPLSTNLNTETTSTPGSGTENWIPRRPTATALRLQATINGLRSCQLIASALSVPERVILLPVCAHLQHGVHWPSDWGASPRPHGANRDRPQYTTVQGCMILWKSNILHICREVGCFGWHWQFCIFPDRFGWCLPRGEPLCLTASRCRHETATPYGLVNVEASMQGDCAQV